MASVPILSDGKNTAVYLDNSQINQSAGQLRSDILGAEKLKLNKALQEEQDFLKAIQTDPVGLMTQAGIKQQADVLKQFNERWTDEMRKNNGILSTDQKIQMAQDKVAVQSFQQNLAANQQRALEEMKVFRANPSKYDQNTFYKSYLDFLETGEYSSALRARPGQLNESLDKDIRAYQLAKPKENVQSIAGKSGKIITTITTGDPKEGAQRVLSLFLNDDTGGLLEDAAMEFMNESPEVQKKYLDANQDGQVTEDEINLAQSFGNDVASIASNPIVKWAMETKGQRYQTSRPQVSNPPSSMGFGLTLGVGGKNVPYKIPESEGRRDLSNVTKSEDFYKTYVDEPINFSLDPTSKYVDEYGDETEVPVGLTVDARIVGYARDKDMVVLQPTTGVGSIKNAQTILVPRSRIESQLPEGVLIRVGDKNIVLGEGKATAQKPKAY